MDAGYVPPTAPMPTTTIIPSAAPGPHNNYRNDENRIFVGGIPYHLSDDQCRELLGSFGAIKHFEMIKDKETGTGKG
jgi:splicing factor U2AF subunit